MTFSEWWNKGEQWKTEGGTGFSKSKAAWDAAEEEEKNRRIYYQNIVYHVCNALDRIFAKRPGKGIVCGTVDTPTQNVEAAMQIVEYRCTEWAKIMTERDHAAGGEGPAMNDIVEKIQAGNYTHADVDAAVQEILRLRKELAEAMRRLEVWPDE